MLLDRLILGLLNDDELVKQLLKIIEKRSDWQNLAR